MADEGETTQSEDEGERVLYRVRSDFQDIVLAREPDGQVNLTLDDVWQFRSHDEHVFHEVLADTPILMSTAPTRVLILGGGDGLALRNVLRYDEVEEVTICELDPRMIEMTRTVPEMVELSDNSLADPRVRVVVDDALEFIHRQAGEQGGAYQVVICDFPAQTRPELAPLFSASFFAQLAAVTDPGGVVAVQVSQDPEGFWPICDAVEASFAWVHPMLANMDVDGIEDDSWADFVIASHSPRTPLRDPASGVRFLTRARVPRLRIKNRGGDHFETDEYGQRPFA